MIGIYKITSPTSRIYIGQSINIENRKYAYSIGNNNLKRQPKIYNSIKKHGIENHTFEILEECTIGQLNERETYWKQHYLEQSDNNWSKVLFCGLHDNGGGPKSEETKQKISNSLSGIKRTEETKNKLSLSLKGKNKTDNHKNNISNSKSNISNDTLSKMSQSLKGKKLGKKSIGSGRKAGFRMSDEHKEKLRQAKIGKPSNNKHKII
jgi:group I intron endonuclease